MQRLELVALERQDVRGREAALAKHEIGVVLDVGDAEVIGEEEVEFAAPLPQQRRDRVDDAIAHRGAQLLLGEQSRLQRRTPHRHPFCDEIADHRFVIRRDDPPRDEPGEQIGNVGRGGVDD